MTDPQELLDDDPGADADTIVEILDVLVVHADTAVRDEMADRARLVGAVNGVLAAREHHGCIAHRIARRAGRNHIWQVRLVSSHLSRRRPGRMDVFAVDERRSRPLLARPADAD